LRSQPIGIVSALIEAQRLAGQQDDLDEAAHIS
jgi:hypothetical protein